VDRGCRRDSRHDPGSTDLLLRLTERHLKALPPSSHRITEYTQSLAYAGPVLLVDIMADTEAEAKEAASGTAPFQVDTEVRCLEAAKGQRRNGGDARRARNVLGREAGVGKE